MTIASSTNKLLYACNGVQTVFPYTWRIWAEGNLRVVLRGADGTEVPLTLNEHYAVSGVNDDEGGNVTLIGSYALTPPATGQKLLVKLNLDYVQETHLVENAATPAAVLETALDRLTAMVIQVREQVDRAIKVAETEENPVFSAQDLRDAVGDTAASAVAAQQALAAAAQVAVHAVQVGLDRDACDEDAAIAAEARSVTLAAATAAKGYAESAAANSAAPAWAAGTLYSFPDIVAYTDGCTYRCIGAEVIGTPPPESALWVQLTTRMTDYFEMDEDGGMMPAVIPGYSVEFDLDEHGDIQPR